MGGGIGKKYLPQILLTDGSKDLDRIQLQKERIADNDQPKQQQQQQLLNPAERPFPRLGINISAIDHFIATIGDASTLQGMTTTDVCVKYVIPLTQQLSCSYCEKIIQETANTPTIDNGIAIANVFVSHAWKYQFLDVINTLRQAELNYQSDHSHHNNHNNSSVYYYYFWFDLFSNNQHDTSNIPYEWWEGTFKTAIQTIGHTMLMIHPWNHPIPLTRAWCLFEIFCSVDSNSQFDIILTLDQYDIFLNMLIHDYDSVMKMIAIVDLGQSQSFLPFDRERILKVVSEGVGIHTLNKIVINKLWNWVITTLSTAVERETSNIPMKLKLQNRLGLLYRQQGVYTDAIQHFTHLLALQRSYLGEDHLDTMETMNNLAESYGMIYQYDQAETIMKECYEMQKKVLSIEHPDTLMSMHELAWILMCEEKFTLAEELFSNCLTLRTKILGPYHLDTLLTMTQQSRLFVDSGQFEKGLQQYQYCLEMLEKYFGKDHHKTIMAKQMYIAALYDAKVQLEEALKISYENIMILEVKFPENIESLIVHYLYISRIERSQQHWEKSYDAYRIQMRIIREKRGIEDVEYRETYLEWIDTALEAKHYQIAEEVLRDAYDLFLKILGFDHCETMIVFGALGFVLLQVSKEEEGKGIIDRVKKHFQLHAIDDDGKSHYRFVKHIADVLIQERILS